MSCAFESRGQVAAVARTSMQSRDERPSRIPYPFAGVEGRSDLLEASTLPQEADAHSPGFAGVDRSPAVVWCGCFGDDVLTEEGRNAHAGELGK